MRKMMKKAGNMKKDGMARGQAEVGPDEIP